MHADWEQLLDRYLEGPATVRESAVTEVIRSVVQSPARADLRYTTSMWELIVAPTPGEPTPVDAVRVSTPKYPNVLISHLLLVGDADEIERPAEQAVPLFWRFMKEKYGIEGRPTQA